MRRKVEAALGLGVKVSVEKARVRVSRTELMIIRVVFRTGPF